MFGKKVKTENGLYGIIGLGRFGYALAQTLSESGKDLIIIDENEAKINSAAAFTDHAYVVQELSKENFRKVGIDNCDVVIICIGERIDTCILATLNVIQLGVKRVIAKATSAEQGCVLELLGAEVVYPERDMAIRLANRLLAPGFLDFITLSEEVDLMELSVTQKIAEKTVQEINPRKMFGINLIAVKHNGSLEIEIKPDTILHRGDTVCVIGTRENIRNFFGSVAPHSFTMRSICFLLVTGIIPASIGTETPACATLFRYVSNASLSRNSCVMNWEAPASTFRFKVSNSSAGLCCSGCPSG